MATIFGTDLDEILFGTHQDDLIKGEGGHDVLKGFRGSDTLEGGTGDDRLGGGSGDDNLGGDDGDDGLWGGIGDDSLDGGEGDDQLRGGDGDDNLKGGDGDDVLIGNSGADNLEGGAGDDVLFGGQGADTLDGGADDDRVIGGQGDDEMDGGAGHDRVRGGYGDDTGTYRLSENTDATDVYDGGIGFDTLCLYLTAEEAASAEVQADIAAFEAFLAANANPGSDDGPVFQFSAFDLKVRDWEALQIKTQPSPPSIHIEKSTNGEDADTPTGPVLPVGDTANFEYVVTNTGNVALGDVEVTDDQGVTPVFQGGDTDNDGMLDPGETWTYAASTTVTAGQYANIGTASGTDPTGAMVSDDDPSHHFGETIGIHIEKSTNGEDADDPTGPVLAVGDTANFEYVVTNTGNVALGDVEVTDDQGVTPVFQGGDTDNDGMLDPGETWTYAASTTVTAGQYANIGTASGTDPTGAMVSDDDPSHHFGETIGIHIEKSTNGEDADDPTGPVLAVGDTANFEYVVTNTGNVALGDVEVTDDQGVTPVFQGGDTDNDGMLDPGETWTYAASTTVTAGQYANIGTASGTDPTGAMVSDDDPSHHFGADPGIDIEKSTNGEDADDPTGPVLPVGSTAEFKYVVTNAGNVPLSDVTVTDDQGVAVSFDGGDDNGNNLLDLNETWTYSASTTVTEGQYANVGKVMGTDATGTTVMDEDGSHHVGGIDTTLSIGPMRGSEESTFDDAVLQLEGWEGIETLNGVVDPDPSDEVDWSGGGGNPGGYIQFEDASGTTTWVRAPDNFLSDWSCLDGVGVITYDHKIFEVGSIASYFPYEVQIFGGGNEATWNGATPTGPTDWVPITAPINETAWTVTEGNWQDLLASVEDVRILIEQVNGDDVGGIDNIRLIVPEGNEGCDPGTPLCFPVTREGDLSKETTVEWMVVPSGDHQVDADDFCTDDLPSGMLTFGVGESTKDIVIEVSGDLLPEFDETFTVMLKNPTNGEIVDDESEGIIRNDDDGDIVPSILLEKTGTFNDESGDGFAQVGETISYAFAVTNDGNVALSDVTVTDPMVTVSGGPLASLAPGVTDDTTFTGTYVITEADVEAGEKVNTATAAGETPDGDPADPSDDITDDATQTVPLPKEVVESILLEKTGTFNDESGDGFAQVGETISYAFAVTNDGNVALSDVTVTDPMVTVSGGPLASLAPGVTDDTTFTGTYVITEADVEAGEKVNTATAAGEAPDGDPADPSDDVIDSDTETVLLPGEASILLEKTGTFNDESGDGFAQVGETISYVFAVTNTGGVTLSDVAVTDPMVTVSGGPLASLAPGATDDTTFTGTYVITQADIDAEEKVNTATAAGEAPDGDPADPGDDITDDDTETVVLPGETSIEDLIFWQNGPETITIGSADAKSIFDIGTNAATPAGVLWTGAAAIGTDDWSQGGNWQGGSPPTESDEAIFGAVDSGGLNIVDQDFTIASLHYTGAGSHTTDLGDDPNTPGDQGNELTVTGDVTIGTANTTNTGSLNIDETAVVAHLSRFSIGLNTTGSGAAIGYLRLNGGANLDASDVDSLVIGYQNGTGPGTADGRVVLGSNTMLDVGGGTGSLSLGYNRTHGGDATGVFDALNTAADVTLDLNEFNIGLNRGNGTASGTLKWNQTEEIHANWITFGRGSGATTSLEVPDGGTLRLGSAADRIGSLYVAYDDTSSAGTLNADLDFDVAGVDPTVEAYITGLVIGYNYGGADSVDGRVVLGSNTMLDVGGGTGSLSLGYNRTHGGDATGVFDALNTAADVTLDLNEFNIALNRGNGTASGTLKWNQTEEIHANWITFGRGSGATTSLEVPDGGTLRLGSAADRIGSLYVAYDDTSSAGTLNADLDFDVAGVDPTVEAYITGLVIGYNYGGADSVDGRVVLGSNTMLDVGGGTGSLSLGYNRTHGGDATGVFDALNTAADVTLDLNEFNIGLNRGNGTASGTLKWNQTEEIHANWITFGRGSGATTSLEVPDGGTLRLGSAADRIGSLYVAYDDTSSAGTLNADLDFDVAGVDPTVEAYITGLVIGYNYGGADSVDGRVVLGSNTMLDVGGGTGSLSLGYNRTHGGDATGVFDALNTAADVTLDLNEFNIGLNRGNGTASGTLKWNQTEEIHANWITFGRGSGATTSLEVPDGGTLRLGSAADRIGSLYVAYDDTSSAGTLNADLDFDVAGVDPTVEAYITGLVIGYNYGGADSVDGRVVLGSNTMLDVGGGTGSLSLGYNRTHGGDATGVFDALNTAADVTLDLNEFNIGLNRGNGTASGTLKWNQTEEIHANWITFGRGSGATTSLEVPDGGTLRLGSAADRIGSLYVAYDDTSSAGTLNADLDFDVAGVDPTVEAYITGLVIGYNYGGADSVDGRVVLGSNTMLDVGGGTGSLSLGYNRTHGGTADGEIDASKGTFNGDFNQLSIGLNAGNGTASGTLTTGAETSIEANVVNIGQGAGATGTFNFADGVLEAGTINLTSGAFNFTGGRLSVTTFNGDLHQDGGTLAPGTSAGKTTVNGDYDLASAGTLEIEILGLTAGSSYDQVDVNGTVDCNADGGVGGTLDVVLGFLPSVSDAFLVVDNDGADSVLGLFEGKGQGAEFGVAFSTDTVTFEIDYLGGDGNDVELTVTDVSPAPVAAAAFEVADVEMSVAEDQDVLLI